MKIVSFVAKGFEGETVVVEAARSRSSPGCDIVGLPDGAVKESRDRVRAALRNSGYLFPQERVLINLSPAGVKKEGAAFDLPIALSVLLSSGQIFYDQDNTAFSRFSFMALGELNLSGTVCPVPGILAAVTKAEEEKIEYILVSRENINEAVATGYGTAIGVTTLCDAVSVIRNIISGRKIVSGRPENELKQNDQDQPAGQSHFEDVSDIRGAGVVKRAMEIAAAGRHNLFLFGPPGSGKTMAARRYPSLLPKLSREESLEVSKIYSIAGKIDPSVGVITFPPFRAPHHSASLEGLIGGGRGMNPGEISYAHKGVLFLDEAPEFHKSILQSLREPLEEGKVYIARASQNCWFPSDFQLIMAANPCPCGNLGRDDKVCMCSKQEIESYWKKMGGPLLDRVDMRIPLTPVSGDIMFSKDGEKSRAIRNRVMKARKIQEERFRNEAYNCNARIPPGMIASFCALTEDAKNGYVKATQKLGLSSRACHSVLKVARTIADLNGAETIAKAHLFEAVQHRRYGDGDYFWSERF